MREIDQVRITLLRMFRGAVRLPEEIIDEMLKAFLHTRGAGVLPLRCRHTDAACFNASVLIG